MECGVRAVSEALCSQYLDWALLVGGMRKARKIYHRWFTEVHSFNDPIICVIGFSINFYVLH